MEEIWKDIKGFENVYQISNYGRLKSLNRFVKNRNGVRLVKEKILKPVVGTCGYFQYPLKHNGIGKTILIHIEVANAFIENPENFHEVNHKDENKLNNYFKNLEWCNRSYNNTYKNRKQREIETQRNTHPSRKKIQQINKNGDIVNIFNSEREAERITGILHNNISNCINGNRKTAGGYFWELVPD